MNGWEKVYATHEPHLVEIVKTILEKNEIESAVLDKRDSMYPTLGEMELYVKQDDMVLARFLINEWEKEK